MMLLAQWLCAHLLAEFLLQWPAMLRQKKRLKYRAPLFWLHLLIHGALFYLIGGQWNNLWLPLILMASHGLIDLWKLGRKDTMVNFLAEQTLHVLVLLALWWWILPADTPLLRNIYLRLTQSHFWLVMLGILLVTWPAGKVIGLATTRWRQELTVDTRSREITLAEAGKWIGMLERVMVYLFVLTGQYAGIGFLITAKSILRYSDIKKDNDRREAEYILIGTLMSFSFSICTGIIIYYLMRGQLPSG